METLRKWDKPSTALFLRRRFYLRNVNPIGPSEPRITEDNILRETEDGQVRVTEGA